MVIHLQTSHGQDSLVTVTLPFLWPSADMMKEVTDALLIMVLVLKSAMSSLLYNVSTNIYFMIHLRFGMDYGLNYKSSKYVL